MLIAQSIDTGIGNVTVYHKRLLMNATDSDWLLRQLHSRVTVIEDLTENSILIIYFEEMTASKNVIIVYLKE